MSATEKEVHYTAVIQVEKVAIVQPETKPNGYQVRDHDKPERKVDEVGKIVVRAKTLAKLVEKAAAHLELMEE